MGFMDDDSRGFLISMDLLIAIIPLTIILGMVTADMGNIMFEIEDTVFRGSMDRVAADTMNTLLETSGDPPTWEQTGTANVVGLAKYDQSKGRPIEGTVSPTKLEFLSVSDVQNIIGTNYDYNLTISAIDGSTTFKTLSSTSNNTGKDIVRVDKVVLCSKLETVSSIVGEIRYTGQGRDYNAPAFQTSTRYNDTYDYWIFFVNTGSASANSATIKINSNTINLNSSSINNPYKINSTFLNGNKLNATQFLNNTVEVNITSSNFGNSMDFYIVQAPKNTSSTDINYNNVVPKKCMFILYLWPK